MNWKMCILLGTGLLAAVAMTVSAQENKPPITSSFDALDANKDGKISASEARKDKGVVARFAEGDKNQDGYLDRDEFKAIGGK